MAESHRIKRMEGKMETRRHNNFGVDVTGTPENLDKVFFILNSHMSSNNVMGKALRADVLDRRQKNH